MKKNLSLISSFLCFLLPGCKTSRLNYHKDKQPTINLQSFFTGTVTGHGSFFDWRGRQTRSFTITMIGDFSDNNQGPLKEHFIFDDGSILDRIWNVTFMPNGSYEATADDIAGIAKGVQSGNAAYSDYVITIPYKNSTINVRMDDWCYQLDEKTVLNRAKMKIFGFPVAEMIIMLSKD